MKIKTHGISVYPEVCQKADLAKMPPDVIVKEPKKSTNIDFEKGSSLCTACEKQALVVDRSFLGSFPQESQVTIGVVLHVTPLF